MPGPHAITNAADESTITNDDAVAVVVRNSLLLAINFMFETIHSRD